MTEEIDALLRRYDQGMMSRRELLGALGAALAVAPAHAQSPSALGPVRQLNHVTVFVPDVAKSAKFYQDLFGMTVLTRQDPGVNLDCGAGFLGIYPATGGAAASINHLCLGLDKFDADGTLKTLTDRGVKARIRQRGDTKELYLTDPDGLSVQLQDTTYIGGTGPLGSQKPR
jgi:catechol 2,3-dioxygenase-like lactoylglutathione lyase family enzyme